MKVVKSESIVNCSIGNGRVYGLGVLFFTSTLRIVTVYGWGWGRRQ